MNSDVNEKKWKKCAIILTIMSENVQANKKNFKVSDSKYNIDKNQPLQKNMNITSNLKYIKPISTQVWNCDEIGFDPNGYWN